MYIYSKNEEQNLVQTNNTSSNYKIAIHVWVFSTPIVFKFIQIYMQLVNNQPYTENGGWNLQLGSRPSNEIFIAYQQSMIID
jgi:hypothetical protein